MADDPAAQPPPPEQQVLQLLLGKFLSRSLTAVADIGVADALAGGPLAVDELAAKVGANADALQRVLRALNVVGVFEVNPDGTVVNNPLSDALRQDAPNSVRALVRWINDPAGWEPWGRLDHSLKTGRPATEAVWQGDVFDWLKDHPSSLERFQEAMSGFSEMTGHAVAEAYDFSGCRRLVDVGGGHGAMLSAIVGRYSQIQGVLYDRPEVVAEAKVGLGTGIEAVEGDFFSGVPQGADIYIMKHIIHDWDDERSAKILRHCRDAMTEGGKVLVVEQLLSDKPEAAFAKLIDLEMLVMTPGGRERSEADFAALLQRSGLRLGRIVPTPSPVVVVEAVAG